MSADCRRLDEALASSDESAIAGARPHAESCARCREQLDAFAAIAAAAPALKKSWESPGHWTKIRESLAREAFAPAATAERSDRSAPSWPAWLPIVAIATLFLVSFIGLQVFRPNLGERQIFGVRSLPKDPLMTDVALEDVEPERGGLHPVDRQPVEDRAAAAPRGRHPAPRLLPREAPAPRRRHF